MEQGQINVRNMRIGDVLKEFGYITEEQLNSAIEYQKQNRGKRLGNILIELNYITEKQMLMALASRLNMKFVEMSNVQVDIEAVEKIPRQLAEKYCMLAAGQQEGTLTLIVTDPMNFYGIEDIRQLTGMRLEIEVCEEEPLTKAIRYYYAEVDARKAANEANENTEEIVEDIELGEGDDETPVINLLNSLIKRAYSTNASDIHIEPFEDKTTVRMRIDGTIVEYVTLRKGIHAPLIARIKILSDLDIAERRIPQDGHFRIQLDGDPVNIRVSMIPTVFGEKAVLRLLTNNASIDYVDSYGMRQEEFEKFSRMLKAPNGIIYLTGPTGSGKTTTLYMVLQELSKRPVNISTIEDPVEKNLSKVNQMQVNNQAGLHFETGLRALLRQDPDIIMVGETRDTETASISVRAAITGHLVLSTLHTNDAASSIIRLEDMGVEKYLVASSLVGIVAQRLVRKVCPDCAREDLPTQEEIEFIGKPIKRIKRAAGCHLCNYTGYRGRTAVHEVLVVDRNVKNMISHGSTVDEIKEYCVEKQNMKTIKDCGVALVEDGVTTMEELIKIAY